MWMVFCENGQYASSINLPAPTTGQLGTFRQNGGVINRVYFAPNSDSYIVTDGKTCTTFQTPPADLLAAVQQVLQAQASEAQPLPPSVSWAGNGIWAVFGVNAYRLGPSVPASLTAKLNSIGPPSDANDRWSPNGLWFAPSGEWMLQGSGAHDQGSAELYYSSAFPAAVQQWMPTVPMSNHSCIQNFEFDPSGGWVMVDDLNNVYYSPSGVDPALQQQVTTMQAAGNVVVDIACLTLNQPVLPMSPIQQPPPLQAGSDFETSTQFETIEDPTPTQRTTAFLMKTVVNEIDSGGNVFGETGLATETLTDSFHGAAVLSFLDFTGNLIAALSDPPAVAERFAAPDNVLGSGQGKPGFNTWQASIGTEYLQLIRQVCISHVYSPNSIEQDISNWTSAIGSNVQNLIPIAQAVSLLSGGKSNSSTSSSTSSGKSSG